MVVEESGRRSSSGTRRSRSRSLKASRIATERRRSCNSRRARSRDRFDPRTEQASGTGAKVGVRHGGRRLQQGYRVLRLRAKVESESYLAHLRSRLLTENLAEPR